MEKYLRNEIYELKRDNFEQFCFMLRYTLNNWFSSGIQYGFFHPITKKNYRVFEDYLKILKEENLYLNLLLQNELTFESGQVFHFLDLLDEKNAEMMMFFYQTLDDFEDSISFGGEEYRFQYPKRNFKFITENQDFQNELTRLILGTNVLQEYYTFGDSFWRYLNPRTTVLNEMINNNASCFYGVYPKISEDHILRGIKMIVPQMDSLETLLINVHELNYAYALYQRINQPFEDLDYEFYAKQAEQDFMERCFYRKRKQLFGDSER